MKRPKRINYDIGEYGNLKYLTQLEKYTSYLENKQAKALQLHKTQVISSPKELQPVLAYIENLNDLGTSKWFEVVYYDDNWQSYAGSKTFNDGETVIRWKYCNDCL